MELNPAFAGDSDAATLALRPRANGDQSEPASEFSQKSPIVLDPSDDLILKLEETSLRVSSKVLSVASNVFRVMFGPHFQEGESLSKNNSNSPAIIPLPDDDPHTTTHPWNLAILSDKYNCVTAVSLATDAWVQILEASEAKASDDELFSLAESAYVLDHAVLFECTTKRILMNDVGGIPDRITGWKSDDVLSIKVYGELEKRRRNLYTELSHGLYEPISHLVGNPEYEPTTTVQSKQFGCINHTWHKFNLHDALQVSSYVRELRCIHLYPLDPQKQKLANVVKAFNKFEDRDISQLIGFGIFPKLSQCQACVLDARSRIANLSSKVLKGCNGLCLDCIDKDRSGGDEV